MHTINLLGIQKRYLVGTKMYKTKRFKSTHISYSHSLALSLSLYLTPFLYQSLSLSLHTYIHIKLWVFVNVSRILCLCASEPIRFVCSNTNVDRIQEPALYNPSIAITIHPSTVPFVPIFTFSQTYTCTGIKNHIIVFPNLVISIQYTYTIKRFSSVFELKSQHCFSVYTRSDALTSAFPPFADFWRVLGFQRRVKLVITAIIIQHASGLIHRVTYIIYIIIIIYVSILYFTYLRCICILLLK